MFKAQTGVNFEWLDKLFLQGCTTAKTQIPTSLKQSTCKGQTWGQHIPLVLLMQLGRAEADSAGCNYCVTSTTTSHQQYWKQSSLNCITVNHSLPSVLSVCEPATAHTRRAPGSRLCQCADPEPVLCRQCHPGRNQRWSTTFCHRWSPCKRGGQLSLSAAGISVVVKQILSCTSRSLSSISHTEKVLLLIHKYWSSCYSKDESQPNYGKTEQH